MDTEINVSKINPTSPGVRSKVWFPAKTFSSLGRVKRLSKRIYKKVGITNSGKKTIFGKKNYTKKYASFVTSEFFFNNCEKVLLTFLGKGKEASTLKPFSIWKSNSGFFFKTNADIRDNVVSKRVFDKFAIEPGSLFKKGFAFRLGEKGSSAGNHRQFASSNGTFFTVIKKTQDSLIVKLPSKKVRSFDINSYYKSGPNLFQKKKKNSLFISWF